MQDLQTAHAETVAPQEAAVVRKGFSFDTAAAVTLLGSFALSFVLFLPFATIPFLHTKIAVIALGVIASIVFFIIGRLTRGSAIIPPFALIGAFWLVPLAYLLSMFFSGTSIRQAFIGNGFATDSFAFTLLLALIATLTAVAFRRQSFYRLFFVGGAWLVALLLVVQWVFIILGLVFPTLISGTATLVGSFIDLGALSTLAVITALIAFRFFTFPQKTNVLVMALLGLALIGVVLTNSLGYWITIGLVSFGFFVETVLRKKSTGSDEELEGVQLITAPAEVENTTARIPSRSFSVSILTLCVSVFFIFGATSIGSIITNGLKISFVDVRPSWQATFVVGSKALGTSPFFGTGPGTFGQQWLQFRDSSVNDTIFWNTEFASGVGFIPTSFVTTGAVGVLAWIVFLGLLLYVGVRTLFGRMPENKFARFATLASFVGTFYIFFLALTQTPGALILLLGAFFLGLFVSSQRFAGAQKEWGIVFARSPRIGFVIVFTLTLMLLASVVTAYGVVVNYLSDVSYSKAAVLLNEGNIDGAEQELRTAASFAESSRAYQAFAFVNIARMNKIANDEGMSETTAQQSFQTALQTALQAAVEGTKQSPKDYQAWVTLATVYQSVVPLKVPGAYDNAKAAYEQAIALNPTNPALLLTLAQLEVANQNLDGAREYLGRAIALKKDYIQAIFTLSQVEAQQGKTKEALAAAEAALYFAPNEQTILLQVGLLRSAANDSKGAIAAFGQALDVNPQFANARYFLGVMYAITGDYTKAVEALEAVAAISSENATAVQDDLAALKENKNPFPPSRLGALGLTAPDVKEVPSTTQQPAKEDGAE